MGGVDMNRECYLDVFISNTPLTLTANHHKPLVFYLLSRLILHGTQDEVVPF